MAGTGPRARTARRRSPLKSGSRANGSFRVLRDHFPPSRAQVANPIKNPARTASRTSHEFLSGRTAVRLPAQPSAPGGPAGPGSAGAAGGQAGPRSDQLQFERLEHRPGAVAHAELGQNVRDMVLDRALG